VAQALLLVRFCYVTIHRTWLARDLALDPTSPRPLAAKLAFAPLPLLT